jgi:hypothetical protein
MHGEVYNARGGILRQIKKKKKQRINCKEMEEEFIVAIFVFKVRVNMKKYCEIL